MAFEIYKPRSEKTGKLAAVYLSKSSIVLNKVAREKVNADKFELAFDHDSNTIQMMPSKEGQAMKKMKDVNRRAQSRRFHGLQKGTQVIDP